ncbi:response regulator [Paenibacillus spiritus]|uniref:Circadian input-output histidine kinase CikA n=1 Tax=Paenibacillus spiritus TaxID=2496557 RepID=A0A5J5G979_9BACL|nr:CHASE3 domain-containing protein [Paenibacillus spiritus]KAA9004161.1 response regulator [Paenibacillus spiritus]
MILLLLGLFLLIVSGRISSLEQETVVISDHDIEVHDLTNMIEKNVLDMETGQRGYALTGDERYLSPFNEGITDWKINYSKLVRLISGNDDQLRNLQEIRANIELWIERAGQYVVDLKQEGNDAEVEAFFRNNDVGKTLIDQIRSQAQYFRDTEKELTADRIVNLKEGNRRLLITMYVLWALVAAAAVLAALVISNSLVGTLKRVIKAVDRIAGGRDIDERIEVRTRDEICDLAMATNRLLDTMERERHSVEQVNALSMQLQESSDVSVLSRSFLQNTALALEIQYGAVYIAEESRPLLVRKAVYAGGAEEAEELPVASAAFGEGLLGQAAADQRMLVLENLPDDYLTVRSGLGRTAPRQDIIAPIVFEGYTVGVVELASITKWSAHQFQLLGQFLEVFAVAVNSSMTRMQLFRLYEESQNMNEKLQAQSEELQTQSEELQSQARELSQLNVRLEKQKQVAENAAARLEQSNIELRQSSRYKTEFLANMSHELRTPLNSMLILSQLLTENRAGSMSEEELGYANVIYESGSELLAMINDILDLSKMEAGKMQLDPGPVDLTELPVVLERTFGPLAEKRKLTFSVIREGNVPDLMVTDGLRLHQILKNLLSNALKFTEEGSVSLRLFRSESFPDSGKPASGTVIGFAVADTGIGISRENREHIFEAFRQADGSTARKYGGTGLGLSISRQLAELLGGVITLDSVEGRGSVFTLYLPSNEKWLEEGEDIGYAESAAGEEEAPQASRDSSPALAGLTAEARSRYERCLEGRTVLVVDDDLRNIFAMQQALGSFGMTVLVAQNGYECLQMVREKPSIDLILLDIMMPGLDGYDTLSILREELLRHNLPIIAVSAKTSVEDRKKCLEAGASDFLAKPVQIPDLLALMCKLMAEA